MNDGTMNVALGVTVRSNYLEGQYCFFKTYFSLGEWMDTPMDDHLIDSLRFVRLLVCQSC